MMSSKSRVASSLGWALRKINSGYDRLFDPHRSTMLSLEPKGAPRGRALLSYKIEGYAADADDPATRTHNHFVEGLLLPAVLLELGYAVDYISYLNRYFRPKRRYDLFIGSRTYFEANAVRLNPDCIKIVHLDTAHWLFNNTAALRRLQEVQSGRGVALSSYMPIEVNRGIEAADCATLLGNSVTYQSYAFAGKRIYQVPNPVMHAPLWIEPKDFEASRRRFLWLGSNGLVHKGLDLVLEAFARMPEMHLTVCGPIERHPEFSRAFQRELYETPNIHTHGWIDVTSEAFVELARRTIAVVYPSCAEGCAGSVINCMAEGLIPVVSREAGIDLGSDFGLQLETTSIVAVEAAVRRIAATSPDKLEAEARATWAHTRMNYSHDRYKQILSTIIEEIVASGRDRLRPGFVPMSESEIVMPRRAAV